MPGCAFGTHRHTEAEAALGRAVFPLESSHDAPIFACI
jgi:hypothetical protein